MTRNEVKRLCREGLTICAVNAAFLYGGIVGINLVGSANATVAWVLILACVAGFLRQPWAIFFAFFVEVRPPYFAIVAFLLTCLTTLWINEQRRRAKIRTWSQRFAALPQTRVAAVFTLTLCALVAVSEYKDFPVRQAKAWGIANFGTAGSQFRHYSAHYGQLPYPDARKKTILWRDKVAAQDVTDRLQYSGVHRISTPSQLPPHFAHQAPYWWQPRLTPASIVYQRSSDSSSGDGATYAVYDPATEFLYVMEQ